MARSTHADRRAQHQERDDLTRELFERRGEIATQLVQSIDEQIVELAGSQRLSSSSSR